LHLVEEDEGRSTGNFKDEIQGFFAPLRMTAETGAASALEKHRVERYGRYWLVEFFGVLRFAQNDGQNRGRLVH
jgi:hypothetical protein